jgi:F-type H+-transporting ATPase subunit b
MENQLLFQLGINWKLFLSQAVNFFILLAVLTFFVYKPLIKIIKERNQKIKEGLDKAEEADTMLKEVDIIGKGKIKEAEQESIEIIKATEQKAKDLEHELQKKNEEKQLLMQKESQEQLKKQLEENKKVVLDQAAELIKKTIIKTVELKPDAIDEALIKKAVDAVKNEKE